MSIYEELKNSLIKLLKSKTIKLTFSEDGIAINNKWVLSADYFDEYEGNLASLSFNIYDFDSKLYRAFTDGASVPSLTIEITGKMLSIRQGFQLPDEFYIKYTSPNDAEIPGFHHYDRGDECFESKSQVKAPPVVAAQPVSKNLIVEKPIVKSNVIVPAIKDDSEVGDSEDLACGSCMDRRKATVNLPCACVFFCIKCSHDYIATGKTFCPACTIPLTEIKTLRLFW